MSAPRRVAVLVETSRSFGRDVLRGVGQYAARHGRWSLFFEPRDLFTLPPPWLRSWKGDGVIARLSTRPIARAVLRTGLPVVNLSSAFPDLDVPLVQNDSDALARTAFAHLVERGFRHFAYLGDAVRFSSWSKRLGQSFGLVVRRAGHWCEEFRGPGGPGRAPAWEREQAALGRWVAGLPRPVAVFAVNDSRGQRLLDACRRVQVAVPDDVAVLASENDELVCSLSTPPLSSLLIGGERIGHEAARLLDQVMGGRAPRTRLLKLPPLGVATRESTDVQAHADPIVASALGFIRQNLSSGVRVRDLVGHTGVSRTTLNQRFRACVGRSPHDEIVRVQLQRATDLLARTSLKTLAIAQSTGFRHLEYMGAVFRKKLGVSPGEYRKRLAR